MKLRLLIILVVFGLGGCNISLRNISLRTTALVLAASADIITTIRITEATPDERAVIRADLVAVRSILTLVDLSIDEKIALIDAIDGAPQ